MIKHILVIVAICAFLSACANTGYNTQKGAAIGAGIGALAGQAIGHNTEATLIGIAAGTLLGAITGNAVDQNVMGPRLPQRPSRVLPRRAYAACGEEAPPGEWIKVPGKWVGGRWVPAHKVWVPINP